MSRVRQHRLAGGPAALGSTCRSIVELQRPEDDGLSRKNNRPKRTTTHRRPRRPRRTASPAAKGCIV